MASLTAVKGTFSFAGGDTVTMARSSFLRTALGNTTRANGGRPLTMTLENPGSSIGVGLMLRNAISWSEEPSTMVITSLGLGFSWLAWVSSLSCVHGTADGGEEGEASVPTLFPELTWRIPQKR